MIRYVSSKSRLRTFMRLLRDHIAVHILITLNTFYVFKSFVANPNKEVVGILADNKVKFLTYFGGFHKE
jgi:hypothetical protein